MVHLQNGEDCQPTIPGHRCPADKENLMVAEGERKHCHREVCGDSHPVDEENTILASEDKTDCEHEVPVDEAELCSTGKDERDCGCSSLWKRRNRC